MYVYKCYWSHFDFRTCLQLSIQVNASLKSTCVSNCLIRMGRDEYRNGSPSYSIIMFLYSMFRSCLLREWLWFCWVHWRGARKPQWSQHTWQHSAPAPCIPHCMQHPRAATTQFPKHSKIQKKAHCKSSQWFCGGPDTHTTSPCIFHYTNSSPLPLEKKGWKSLFPEKDSSSVQKINKYFFKVFCSTIPITCLFPAKRTAA